jgi:hypothetical protein
VAQSHTPQDCCVRFAGVVTFPNATLATGRCATILPGPDLHRLERASFAWRTENRLLAYCIGFCTMTGSSITQKEHIESSATAR